MAVTGLLKSNTNHAVVMTQFARKLLIHTRNVASRLSLELGPDTEDLTVRVGIHSGSVTYVL